MKPINWGIIGCGNVTEKKSGPAFNKIENSRLLAVMRRNKDKVMDYAKRHNVPKWTTDASELINDSDINAVYIATPPVSHNYYTQLAAKAGKAVYVEKPMARTFSECQQMISVCEKFKVPLFVAYYRRSLPRFLKIRELLNQDEIGKIRFIKVQLNQPAFKDDYDKTNLPWRVKPEISGGGYFVDLGSHIFDLLDFYFGPVTEIKSIAANLAGLYDAEDTVSVAFGFRNDIIGTASFSFVSNEKKDMISVLGDKGELHFSAFEDSEIYLVNQKNILSFNIPHPPHIQQPHIQTIVDELTGIGECPCHGTDGARTSKVIDQILCDYRKKINFKLT